MLWKIIQYNSITNNNGIIKYDYTIIKITTSFDKAVEVALNLKLKTKKLYKVERV